MTKGKGGNNAGPWGRPSSDSSGSGSGSSGSGRGGKTPPPDPDNIEDLIRKSQERFRGFMPGGVNNRKGIVLAVLGLAVLWLASGVYVIEPEEEGVVLRFGKYHRTESPGLRYHIPYPVEHVLTPQVTRVQRTEVGYREMVSRVGSTSREQPVPEESRMLTGDNNVIMVQFSVQWVIKNAKDFLFNIRNPEETVKDVAESVMREVISNHPLDAALADNKEAILLANKALLQKRLDDYGAGINIERVQLQAVSAPEQVKQAFDDVQAARQDRDTTINQATAYANEVLPKARGEAQKLLQEALAYKAQVTNRATGDASRFVAIYNEYKVAKDVTKKRLYLETLENIMKDMDKVILSGDAPGVVPYMALPEIEKRQKEKDAQP